VYGGAFLIGSLVFFSMIGYNYCYTQSSKERECPPYPLELIIF
jgi:hypothetical protein